MRLPEVFYFERKVAITAPRDEPTSAASSVTRSFFLRRFPWALIHEAGAHLTFIVSDLGLITAERDGYERLVHAVY